MNILNDNLQRVIAAGTDTAPLTATAITGTASYEVATKGVLRIKDYVAAEIMAMRRGDGLIIDSQLFIIAGLPNDLNSNDENNPSNILIRIDSTRVPTGAFATKSIKWAKGNRQPGYPNTGWSLNGSDYDVDGVQQTGALNFLAEAPMVLVVANDDVVVSSAHVSVGGGSGGEGTVGSPYTNNEVTPLTGAANHTFAGGTYNKVEVVCQGGTTIQVGGGDVVSYEAGSVVTFQASAGGLLDNDIKVTNVDGTTVINTLK